VAWKLSIVAVLLSIAALATSEWLVRKATVRRNHA
jgi:hypothetical protein